MRLMGFRTWSRNSTNMRRITTWKFGLLVLVRMLCSSRVWSVGLQVCGPATGSCSHWRLVDCPDEWTHWLTLDLRFSYTFSSSLSVESPQSPEKSRMYGRVLRYGPTVLVFELARLIHVGNVKGYQWIHFPITYLVHESLINKQGLADWRVSQMNFLCV